MYYHNTFFLSFFVSFFLFLPFSLLSFVSSSLPAFVSSPSFLLLLQGLVMPCFGIVLQRAIAVFAADKPTQIRNDALWWGGIFFAVAAVAGITIIPMFWAFMKAGAKLGAKIRLLLLKSMLRQDQAWHDHPDNNTGRLTWTLR